VSRHTLTDTALDVGATTHTVSAGITIATLLPLTNTTAAPDLARWDPDRWHRRRLVAAMTETALTLVDTYDLTPEWVEHPLPVPAQIGGVARAATPCPLAYRRRN
jgi:hypothetical protein